MEKSISIADMLPVIREILDAGKTAKIKPQGISMQPSISNGDVVELKAFENDAEKYDVVLYERDNKAVVLHRIVGKKRGGYVLAGDGQRFVEYPILPSQIVGIVLSVERDGVKIYDKNKKKKLLFFLHDIRLFLPKLKLLVKILIKRV